MNRPCTRHSEVRGSGRVAMMRRDGLKDLRKDLDARRASRKARKAREDDKRSKLSAEVSRLAGSRLIVHKGVPLA